jgi:hypothetical protein
VLDDVRGGYVSIELALDDYGVVIRVTDDEHEPASDPVQA